MEVDVEGQRRLFRSRGSPGWPAVVDAVQEASVGGGDGESPTCSQRHVG